MQRKHYLSPVIGNDPLTFVMSDESTDRVGDIIRAAGWKLQDFLRNPIALFNHDAAFVIGFWSDVKVQGKRLIGRLNLLPKGTSERLDELISAVEAGVLRACSVGFRPDPGTVEPNNETGGAIFNSTTLLECSLCAVPANPNSLRLAKSLNLSADTQALIFGRSAASHKAAVHLDMPRQRQAAALKAAPPAPRNSRVDGDTRVVSIGKPFKLKKIHTPPKWRPGMPLKIITPPKPVVVKLGPEGRARSGLDKPKEPHRVVRMTAKDIERGKRRASTVVVKLR